MRKLLSMTLFLAASGSAAHAADLTYDSPASSMSGGYEQGSSADWTGGYVGGFGALASGETSYDRSDSTGFDQSAGGAIGGVQAGYDVQLGQVVLGGVADIALTNVDGEVTTRERVGGSEISQTASTSLDYLGTVRARAGYGGERVLAYGHGGLAYGSTKTAIDQSVRTGGVVTSTTETRESGTKYGYGLGAGVEVKATDNVSVQTEYGYYDLGNDQISNSNGVKVDEDVQFHTVKSGLNFRF
ncbi:outer membrane protein [Fulvimarina sp. MAC3]|uniref:outer membrane protein n=1 Tax=Fulvimarina sp. MAC3 TaxID=3148887 RepID=UPI0031FDDC31